MKVTNKRVAAGATSSLLLLAGLAEPALAQEQPNRETRRLQENTQTYNPSAQRQTASVAKPNGDLAAARAEFVATMASEGVLYDAAAVDASLLGDHVLVHGPETSVGEVTIRSNDDLDSGEVVGEDYYVEASEVPGAAGAAVAGSGLGFAPYESTSPNNCYWLNGNGASSNHSRWCWKKTQIINDGDSSKDYYVYKRSMSMYPSNASGWYARGAKVESIPSVSGRIKSGMSDYSPAGHVDGGCISFNAASRPVR